MSADEPGAGYVGPRHRWRVAMLARALLTAAQRPGPVVDAGCGRGSLALALAAAGRVVLAFDRDREAVAAARQRARARAGAVATVGTGPGLGAGPGAGAGAGAGEAPGSGRPTAGIHVFVADVTAIPLRDGLAAGVAAGELLEHVADDARAAAELARLLAPGAVLAVTVPAGPARFGDTDRAAGHRRRYDRAGLAGLLSAAGLDLLALRGWGFPFGRLYDRLVLGPAFARRGRPAGPRLARAARWRAVDGCWRSLFAVDERLPAGEQGSGWLALAGRLSGSWPSPAAPHRPARGPGFPARRRPGR